MIYDRIPLRPPFIEPLNFDIGRPLWSVMIPSYNCINYLKHALQSVLLQDPGIEKMQIEVVDDCSNDGDVAALVKTIGNGRVTFFRQNANVGSLRNFETCINRSRGKWIHILHGDDALLPGFYKEIETLFIAFPNIGAAFTGFSVLDETGTILYHNNDIQQHRGIVADWLLKISQQQLLRTCAIVVKRSVYEDIGGFYGVHYGEDWEMFVRIAAAYPVAYSPENLAMYRIHQNNISSRFLSSGQNIKDIKKVIETIQQYLPVDKRQEIKQQSLKNFSIYFANNAQDLYKKFGDGRLALVQARAAVALHLNKITLLSLIKLYVKIKIKYNSTTK